MRAQHYRTRHEDSLIADYVARMSESVARRRADIAARAARVEAELAIKARSEFLAGMNHELRTPLNAIIGFATMLRDGATYALDEEQRRSYVDYILQSADLLLGHINTLLEVAALESGAVEVANDDFSLDAALDNAVARAGIRAAAAGVAIRRRGGGDGAAIYGCGDAERTGQAIDPLLQTAIAFSGKGGKIMARAGRDQKGWAEIAIRDNGAGMAPEELNSALDAFKTARRGFDRAFLGPGVGYAIAKTFVEMQGGRFAIESRKNKGTLARISLPPPKESAKSKESAAHAPAEPVARTKETEKTHDAA
jgi:two-component system cell cycle sensor histidine kinase PleC